MSQTPIQNAYLLHANVQRQWLDDRTFIGHSDDNHIVIPGANVSRHHALIQLEGATFWLEDLHSPSGTFVNGQRVIDRIELIDGDTISIGDMEFEFWHNDVPASVNPSESGRTGALETIVGVKTDGWGRGDEVTPSPYRHEPESVEGFAAVPSDAPHSGTGEIRSVTSDDHEDSSSAEPPVSSRASDAELMNVAPKSAHLDSYEQPTHQHREYAQDEYELSDIKDVNPLSFVRLLATSGPVDGQIFEISFEGASIGRVSDNTICILDENLSRHQALIKYEYDAFWLIDIDSANGTYVNGHRLYEPYQLNSGDEIMMGHSHFLVTLQFERTFKK